ncbi:MAG: hypothetical protein WGN25_11360 [Candidatus Electrothrix sp. GW3-4]|uniref:hypothetical protein n=1 Tax=Candidatus Electrothrix sp. GW3-4 TaxID=3126740 RepID=UPI0030D2490A
MKKFTCLLFLVFIFNANLSYASTTKKSASRITNLKIANVLLFHAKSDIELIRYCRENLSGNTEVISKLEESLYRKISEVSSTAPLLKDMGGTPINILASIINYQKNYKPFYTGPYRNQVVDSYLQIITDSLLEQKSKYGRLPTTPLIEFYKQHGME